MTDKIEIIKAPDSIKPYAIIYKPAGLPSAPLSLEDKNNAFWQAAKLFPELLNVQGRKEIEHGLLHRLDTATNGLLIIAATQECYDFLMNEQKEGRIIKKYCAECDIISSLSQTRSLSLSKGETFTIQSYFRPYGPGRKEVRPVLPDSSQTILKKVEKRVLYTTQIEIKSTDKNKNTALVECTITNGYRHQVRSHLAFCGLPVKGDLIYNPSLKNKSTEAMKFCATELSFEYPRGDLNSYDRKDTWT